MTHRAEIPARPFLMVYRDQLPYRWDGERFWHRYELVVKVTDAPGGRLAWTQHQVLSESGRPHFSYGPPHKGGMTAEYVARILCGDGEPCTCHQEATR